MAPLQPPNTSSSPAVEQNDFEKRWQKRFSGFAEQHEDDASIAGWTTTGLEARLRQFRRSFPAAIAGSRWLDAGCGAGSYSRYLASLGASVIGVDYSFPTVKKAKTRSGEGISYCVADATALPLRPDSFDGALSLGVTQALSTSEPLLRALVRSVRPGGQIWVDGLNAWCLAHVLSQLRRRLRGKPRHLRYETPGAVRRILREQGVANIRVIWLPIVPARLHRLQRLIETRPLRILLQLVWPLGALLSHSFIVCGTKRR